MKTIKVKVNDKKEVMCFPDRCLARRGESVKWESVDGHAFGVHFGWKSPFLSRSFQIAKKKMKTKKMKTKKMQTKPEQVAKDACYDSYKYTIGVFDGRHVLMADPELIIER